MWYTLNTNVSDHSVLIVITPGILQDISQITRKRIIIYDSLLTFRLRKRKTRNRQVNDVAR